MNNHHQDINSINSFVTDLIISWYDKISEKNLDSARNVLNEAQSKLRKIKCNIGSNSNALNVIYLSSQLFTALQDFTILVFIAENETVLTNKYMVELCWNKFCDTNKRLEFIDPYIHISENIQNFVNSLLVKLDQWFSDVYGPGLYASAEIFSNYTLCSVCNENLRKCFHIPGQLYAGVRCYPIPQDPRLENVSIVSNPKDPRCRIWPWQIEDRLDKKRIVNLRILSLSNFENLKEDKDAWDQLTVMVDSG